MVIDFSKFRKGSKPYYGRVIDYCPKCNKKGMKTYYPKNKEYFFAHSGRTQLGMLIIDKGCTVRKD